MKKEMKMNLYVLVVIVFVSFACKGKGNKVSSEIKIKEEKQIVQVVEPIKNDSIIHLKGIKLKSDEATTYASVKKSIISKKSRH